MADFIFTVSEVNGYVKKVLEAEELLQNIKIRGEISNYSKSFAGHVYFTLKDEMASVQCVWFAGSAKGAQNAIKDGDRVQVTANVTLYIKGGTYQLVIRNVIKDGTGDLYERFEKLKNQLESEGLFDIEKKKQLPRYPKIVGVITSATGAAIKDITHVLETSWGNVTMRLYPVSVQGERAAGQMIAAVKYFDENTAADMIIIGRGGGSFEDLNCFNNEALVRQIYMCEIPIISAVGHETDFTLCDFVADVREATPSTAAKRAVPQKTEELEKLNAIKHNLKRKMQAALQQKLSDISKLDLQISRLTPQNRIMQTRQQLDMAQIKIGNALKRRFENAEHMIKELTRSIETLNPKNTLQRGYAIIEDKNRKTLTTLKAIKDAEKLIINMHDGAVNAKVSEE